MRATSRFLVYKTQQAGAAVYCSVPVLSKYKTDYFAILATTPAPTVRPPSRIAKRWPSSMAIGVISFTSMVMLSPGMHISVPSGSSMSPLRLVVRKEELRTVSVEERCVAAAFVFRQHVDLGR